MTVLEFEMAYLERAGRRTKSWITRETFIDQRNPAKNIFTNTDSSLHAFLHPNL